MKTITLLLVGILMCSALEFETFQQALNWDPDTFKKPNCGNDDDFQSTLNSYDAWIALILDGGDELEEDLDVLQQAKINIVEARGDLEELDKEFDQLSSGEKQKKEFKQPDQEKGTDNSGETHTENEDAHKENGEHKEGEGEHHGEQPHQEESSDDPFGWGEGEVPQFLHKEHKKHGQSFLQVMKGGDRLKKQARKIIAMAEELDGEGSTSRKIELCDLIIQELDEMIDQLEKLLNSQEYLGQVYEQLKDHKGKLSDNANECGAHLVDLEDGAENSFISKKQNENKKQIKHKISKQKHHNNSKEVSFLQINQQFDEEINQYQVEQQKKIFQNQGMLGFLRNSGKRVTLIDSEQ